jgi:hypothetical protein
MGRSRRRVERSSRRRWRRGSRRPPVRFVVALVLGLLFLAFLMSRVGGGFR